MDGMATGRDRDWQRLARYVRDRRAELDLTQEDVAAAGGPSTATMRLIEGALQANYQPRILRRLAQVLGWTGDSAYRILGGGEPVLLEQSPAVAQPQLSLPEPVSLAERRDARLRKAVLDTTLADPVERVLAEAETDARFPRDPVEAQIWALTRLPERVRAEFIATYRLGRAAQGVAGFA